MDRPAHPNITHWDEVEADVVDVGEVRCARRELGAAAGAFRAGSQTTGLNHVFVPEGQQSYPLHWHTVEEELFVVLDGGEVLLGDDAVAVTPGSVVARAPQTRDAHAFRGGPGGLTYLAWSTRVPGDVVYYPRSQTVNLRGLLFGIDPVAYWDRV